MARRSIILFLVALLAGCAALDRRQTADEIASKAGLGRMEIQTDRFRLTGYVRLAKPGEPVTIYIEGDGLAWRSRSEPSLDPTPGNPLGLKLAAIDSSLNVAYLARPCQYTQKDPNCRTEYWTGKRFSEEVVASVDQAISRIVAKAGAKGVHLVGYSGGGAVAVLVAARRFDAVSLRTVAGNLDSEAINRLHGVSAMPASLNPAEAAAKLARLPQAHYIGGRDKVVPPFVADEFAKKSGDGACMAIVPVAAASHEEGWEDVWQGEAGHFPKCR